MKENMFVAIQELEDRFLRAGAGGGIRTGFDALDKLTGGLQAGEVFVLGARPCMGKSAWVLNVLRHVTVETNLPAAFFSLDLSRAIVSERLLSSQSRVPIFQIRSGTLSPGRDLSPITNAAAKLASASLWIDDSASLNILELQERSRQFKEQHDIRLVAVDGVELVGGKRAGSRSREVAEAASGLRELARGLNLPVLVTANLSSRLEHRADGVPRLSDVCYSIEKNADVVAMLYREEYYASSEGEREASAGSAILTINKNRRGPTGEIALRFRPEHVRFESRTAATDLTASRGWTGKEN